MATIKKPYLVKFDFTTYNTGGRFTARSGEIQIESSIPKNKIDREFVKYLCLKEVVRLKPTYKIFMLDIISIELIK